MSQKKSNHRYFWMLGIAVLLLCMPLIAMQFTSEVDWSFFDFLFMGILLFFVVSAMEVTLRKWNSSTKRIAIMGTILFIFFLIWVELAVGIFPSPFAGS